MPWQTAGVESVASHNRIIIVPFPQMGLMKRAAASMRGTMPLKRRCLAPDTMVSAIALVHLLHKAAKACAGPGSAQARSRALIALHAKGTQGCLLSDLLAVCLLGLPSGPVSLQFGNARQEALSCVSWKGAPMDVVVTPTGTEGTVVEPEGSPRQAPRPRSSDPTSPRASRSRPSPARG